MRSPATNSEPNPRLAAVMEAEEVEAGPRMDAGLKLSSVVEQRANQVRLHVSQGGGLQASPPSFLYTPPLTLHPPTAIDHPPSCSPTRKVRTLVSFASERRVALARTGVRFGGSLATAQAERLRLRGREDQGQLSELAARLAAAGAEGLEGVASAIASIDEGLAAVGSPRSKAEGGLGGQQHSGAPFEVLPPASAAEMGQRLRRSVPDQK